MSDDAKICGCPDFIMCECGAFYPGMTRAEINARVATHQPIDHAALNVVFQRPLVALPKDFFANAGELAKQFKRDTLK